MDLIGSSPVFRRVPLLLPLLLAVLIVSVSLLAVAVVATGGIGPHPADADPLLAPFRWGPFHRTA
jgi:hypothetical protein